MKQHSAATVVCSSIFAGFVAARAGAQTCTVSSAADAGPGTLRACIQQANDGGVSQIDLTGLPQPSTITLATAMPALAGGETVALQGPGAGNLTVSGNGSVQVFFIGNATVTISGLTVAHGLARGGDGGVGGGAGGGAAGMGGGIVVAGGTLHLTGVTLDSNQAVGGTGGAAPHAGGCGGGGGGVAGPGAGADASCDGGQGGPGGAFGGAGGSGGTATTAGTGGIGGMGGPGAGGGGGGGGTNGGNGGAGGLGGGGGGGAYGLGADFNTTTGGSGGPGGFGGGGGGGATSKTGNMVAAGGQGGFGGGDGGSANGGGDGLLPTGPFGAGGGGAGLGGAIFVASGALTCSGCTFTNNSAIGGNGQPRIPPDPGQNASGNGSGFGGAVFVFQGTADFSTTTFSGNGVAAGTGGTGGTAAGPDSYVYSPPPPTTGTIQVIATLDGAPWPTSGTGAVTYQLSGAASLSGTMVPMTFSSEPAGTYTLGYTSGGPAGAALTSISPSATQTLAGGGTLTYALNFTSGRPPGTGAIQVNAALDGAPWPAFGQGAVSYQLQGPVTLGGTTVPMTFSSVPVGVYTPFYLAGGPPDSNYIGALSVPSSNVTAGMTTTVTLLFSTTSGPTLFLQNGRFRVTVEWGTGSGFSGNGESVRLTGDSGYFWFFDPANAELVVKVLDACALTPGRLWFFAAGRTNVHVAITATDTVTGTTKTYTNPLNTAFLPIQDTGTFPCP